MGIILYDSIVCVCGEGSGRAEYVSRGERNESCLWKERGNENKCPPLVPHLLYDHYSGLWYKDTDHSTSYDYDVDDYHSRL